MNQSNTQQLLAKNVRDYNQIAVRYDQARPKPWSEMKFLANDFIKAGDRVLDLGCGAGRFYEFLKDKNIEYTGLDNSEKFIKIAQEKYPQLKFLLGNALNLPFKDNFFDKAYAIALLHHIPSPKSRLKIIKEAKRVLKKDGLLILTVWNLWQRKKTRNLIFKYGWQKILGKTKLDFKDILMDFEGVKDVYFHCFTKKNLIGLVKQAGFKIIQEGEILIGLEKKKQPKLPNSNFYVVAEK